MKVVINAYFGGASLSPTACKRLYDLGSKAVEAVPDCPDFQDSPYFSTFPEVETDGKMYRVLPSISFLRKGVRTDPNLIQVVEEMGSDANGVCSKLKIVEVPDDTSWEISEHDGYERIEETHRSWQ